MKTDDLIDMLARGPDVRTPERNNVRSVALLGAAVLVSFMVMSTVLGVRPNLAQQLAWPAFWTKLVFTLALTLAGWRATSRLSQPGAATASLAVWIGAPLLLMWAIGAYTLLGAAPDARAALIWGTTWRYCPAIIAVLSLPIFGAALLAMRELAPTRLRLAGAAAGFAAGSASAVLYCLHCPEMASPFVGFWYVLGILLPTTLGALVGRRALAW
jgi:hypothetical protein